MQDARVGIETTEGGVWRLEVAGVLHAKILMYTLADFKGES